MPRSPSTPVDIVDVQINEAAVADASAAATEIGKQCREIALQFGDGLDYDRARLVHEARFYAGQSAEAMIELGKRLIVIRHHEPRGDFEEIVQRDIGIAARTARQLMQAAARYQASAIAGKPQAQRLIGLGRAKIIELLAEPDEALVELLDGGTLAGRTIDQIESMTSRELRAALKEAREDVAAKDELLKNKNAQIDDLRMKVRRVQKAPPNEALQQLQREATEHMNDALGCIHGALRAALRALSETPDELGDQSVFAAGLVGQIVGALADLRYEFKLPDVSNAADLKLSAEIAQWNVPTPAEIAAKQADAKTEA